MALPPASPERQLKHRRSIDVPVHARGDGLWEVEARLVGTPNTRDYPLVSGIRPAGDPVHDMTLRLAIDTRIHYPRWYQPARPAPKDGSISLTTPQ